MVNTTERNTSTYAYDANTYSSVIVNMPAVSLNSSIFKCELPSRFMTEQAVMGDKAAKQSAFYRIATDGLLNVMGGLVQATSLPQSERGDRAFAIVQLRRALKGLAYFRGAFFGLRADGVDRR